MGNGLRQTAKELAIFGLWAPPTFGLPGLILIGLEGTGALHKVVVLASACGGNHAEQRLIVKDKA